VHGNVLEMVEDCWTTSHKGVDPYGKAKVFANCTNRVVKGGAWYYLPKVSRSASRARNDMRVFSYFIGFRVLREMD
jgi:formylglycine-generating enzyme required for sulfatase activity